MSLDELKVQYAELTQIQYTLVQLQSMCEDNAVKLRWIALLANDIEARADKYEISSVYTDHIRLPKLKSDGELSIYLKDQSQICKEKINALGVEIDDSIAAISQEINRLKAESDNKDKTAKA